MHHLYDRNEDLEGEKQGKLTKKIKINESIQKKNKTHIPQTINQPKEQTKDKKKKKKKKTHTYTKNKKQKTSRTNHTPSIRTKRRPRRRKTRKINEKNQN